MQHLRLIVSASNPSGSIDVDKSINTLDYESMMLGEMIRLRRKEIGLSLRSLATRLGIDPAYLSRVERSVVPASGGLLDGLARELELPVEELSVLAGRLPPRWKHAFEAAPQRAIDMVDQALSTVDANLLETPHRNAMAFSGVRAIETEDFPFEFLSEVAEAESWRKEINRPTYHLHKWWAQRLGSVFRGIILGSFAPRGANVMEMFYQPTRLPNAVVFDPFMGSGTTVGETLKLGARAVGRDINPVAHFAVMNALRPHSLDKIGEEFRSALGDVRQDMNRYYLGRANGSATEVQYYFWVRYLPCPDCSARVDLFRHLVFSRHAYARRHPEARVVCPCCGEINTRRYDVAETACDACRQRFDAKDGPAKNSKAVCAQCSHTFKIAERTRQLGHPPEARMYAKISLDSAGSRVYTRADEWDIESYALARQALAETKNLYPRVPISPGHNTNQVLNSGFSSWDQMFNDRQLLVLGTLGRRLSEIEEVPIRELLLCAFSGLLEFNNMFTSFKGEGTGAVRHMFSHHVLKPERTPFEANPLAETGSGNFEGIFQRRVARLIRYAADPFELLPRREGARVKSIKLGGLSAPIGTEPATSYTEFAEGRSLYLSVGDSSLTDLPDASIDAIVTDPPFFDNVHYSELADFFWVWQRHLGGDAAFSDASTRSVREVQHTDEREFSERLGSVMAECRRVLTPRGLFVFTYHHSRAAGWQALLRALHKGDWGVGACHPVKAELSVATPKAQAKSPIDLDVIVVCRKREATTAPSPVTPQEVMRQAQGTASTQVSRFNKVGRRLGRNDVLITLAAQVMRHLSWNPSSDTALATMTSLESAIRAGCDALYETQEVSETAGEAEQLAFV